MNSWSVPRTTSLGEGRKSGGANPPYVSRHHPPRTTVGATSPSSRAVRGDSGSRNSNSSRRLIELDVYPSVASTTLMSVRRFS